MSKFGLTWRLVVVLSVTAVLSMTGTLTPLEHTGSPMAPSSVGQQEVSTGNRQKAMSMPGPSSTGSNATPTWVNLTSGAAPSHGGGDEGGNPMVYDAADGYVISVGGPSNSSSPVWLNTTWRYQNGTWTNITDSVGPAPFSAPEFDTFPMTYDEHDGYVLAVEVGSSVSWDFVHGKWAHLNVSCTPIGSCELPIRELGPMAYDSSDGYVVLTGPNGNNGCTYTYSNNVWNNLPGRSANNSTELCPPGVWAGTGLWPYTQSMADDPADKGVILFDTGQTWLFSAGLWTNLTGKVGPSPSERVDPLLTYDPAAGGVLLYGGLNPVTGQAYGDTWLFRNDTWSNLTSGLSPGPAVASSLAFDSAENAAILLGGPTYFYSSTWAWSNSPEIVGLTATATPSHADVGSPIAFNESFQGGVAPFSYSWHFGDGINSTLASPTHTYTASGTYDVQLWVNDSSNHASYTTLNITVSSVFSINPFASRDPTDAGLPTTFNANISGGTPPFFYNWSFGDGEWSTNGTPVHTYENPGNYPVTLWVNNSGGGRRSDTFSVTVNQPLGKPAVSASANPVRIGQEINFTSSESGGTSPYTYSWAFGDGGTGGDLQNITHIYTTNGPFTVTLTVTDAAGAMVESSLNVTITLQASISSNVTVGAIPLSVAFTGRATGGVPTYTYQWTFGDGGTSNVSGPMHTYLTAGTFRVELLVKDSAGHQAEGFWNITATPGGRSLTVSLSANPPILVFGKSTTITAAPQGGKGAYTVSWPDMPSWCGEITMLSLNCTPPAVGTYVVNVSVTDAAGNTAFGSIAIQVTSGTGLGGTGGFLGLPGYDGYYLLGALLAAVLIIGLLVGRDLARRPPPLSERKPDPYDSYRKASAGSSDDKIVNVGKGGSDPAEDIF